jgi:hypothetical protein
MLKFPKFSDIAFVSYDRSSRPHLGDYSTELPGTARFYLYRTNDIMSTEQDFTPIRGHCDCKAITYELLASFLCIHCCHCTWCQRESGSAFALNAIIESSNFRLTSTLAPRHVPTPTPSGDGQIIARCPECWVAVYADYGGDGQRLKYVKLGTIDHADRARAGIKPDVHIFTSTKLEWVDLSGEREKGVPIYEGYYRRTEVWSEEANRRFDILKKSNFELNAT